MSLPKSIDLWLHGQETFAGFAKSVRVLPTADVQAGAQSCGLTC